MFPSKINHILVNLDPRARSLNPKLTQMDLSRQIDQFGLKVGPNRSPEEAYWGDGSSMNEIRPRSLAEGRHLAGSAQVDFAKCHFSIGPFWCRLGVDFKGFSTGFDGQRGCERRRKIKS